MQECNTRCNHQMRPRQGRWQVAQLLDAKRLGYPLVVHGESNLFVRLSSRNLVCFSQVSQPSLSHLSISCTKCIHGVSSLLSALPPGSAAWPEKLRRLAARIVTTTLKSPHRSANSNTRTAARLRAGNLSHSGNEGGLYARSLLRAAYRLHL